MSLGGRLDRLEGLLGREEPLAVTRAREQLEADIEALCVRLSPDEVAEAYQRLLREFPHLRRNA